jgi:hypothetical protein
MEELGYLRSYRILTISPMGQGLEDHIKPMRYST